jgi:hypothetical protein
MLEALGWLRSIWGSKEGGTVEVGETGNGVKFFRKWITEYSWGRGASSVGSHAERGNKVLFLFVHRSHSISGQTRNPASLAAFIKF